eukprot:5595601-Heterocapsa_arctica.AAC.1
MEEVCWQKNIKWIANSDISAQRNRHRKPAPQKAVTRGAARDGLDDGKWENAEFRTTTRQSCTGSSSTTRAECCENMKVMVMQSETPIVRTCATPRAAGADITPDDLKRDCRND